MALSITTTLLTPQVVASTTWTDRPQAPGQGRVGLRCPSPSPSAVRIVRSNHWSSMGVLEQLRQGTISVEDAERLLRGDAWTSGR